MQARKGFVQDGHHGTLFVGFDDQRELLLLNGT
jgi:hypothetical protein